MNKRLIKAAILSVSLITVMAGAAVSPALGNIALAFPDSSETTVKLILSLPSIMIIPFIFVSSYLTSRYTKKHILYVGMIFYLIGGIGGGLVSTMELLLFFRAILGIGVGLIMPIATSLVADFFDGEERTATMGLVSAANNLGGVVLFIMSGILASISWRATFGVYILVIVAMIIVFLYLPQVQESQNKRDGVKARLPKKIYLYGAGMLFIILAFFSIPSNMAFFMLQEGIGDSRNAGIVISISTMAGFVAGVLLKRTTAFLKSYYMVTNIFLLSIGFFIIGMSNHVVMIGIGVGVMGFGVGGIIPTVFDQVSRQVPRTQTVQAMAVVTSMLFLGQFLSPIILDSIGILFANPTVRFIYQFLAISTFLVVIGFLIIALKNRKTVAKEVVIEQKKQVIG